jgi:hypothetical protein
MVIITLVWIRIKFKLYTSTVPYADSCLTVLLNFQARFDY